MAKDTIVRFDDISMEFPEVIANDHISLEIKQGEVFALVGENGAGKSTLMNILYGLHRPTGGSVYIRGEKIESFKPVEAIRRGIGMVHQHFMLVPSFTVAQNIVLSREPKKAGFMYDMKKAIKEVRQLSENYGLPVDPKATVGDISVGMQQRVEILKTLYRGADILILDEPTAVLTPQETEEMFAVIKRIVREQDMTVIIITHKLYEVMTISDRVGVMRGGRLIDVKNTADVNEKILSSMMVGREVIFDKIEKTGSPADVMIEARNLFVTDNRGLMAVEGVNLQVRSGEILGIAGISGCGQKELLEAIAGLQPTEAGTIRYVEDDGSKEELIGKDPLKIAQMGVSLSFVPEDRLGMGLVGNMDLTDNMMLRSFRRGHTPFTNRKPSKELAENVVENLEVVTPGITTPVRRLSGGNVQKVLVGREIASAPTVLLTAYAVRGLDINSSYTIYKLINEQKKNGVAVIFVGEDLDVLMELSDRILVLCGGQVSGIVDARTTDKNQVGMMMTSVGGRESDE